MLSLSNPDILPSPATTCDRSSGETIITTHDLECASRRGLALAVTGVLAVFCARRLVFLLAALLPRRSVPPVSEADLPAVLVLIPARDERLALPGLFAALEALDYPHDRLRVAVVDDGSTDGTGELSQAWAAQWPWAEVVTMPAEWVRPPGWVKADALNATLALLPYGEVVVVYDADHRPKPASLRRLVEPFADSRVAATTGFVVPANATANAAASYSAIEALVHQRITVAAKDRLALAPPTLGSNCAYRRTALRQAGGFPAGALVEDSALTVTLHHQGWRTRLAPDSISEHSVPESISGYLRQHARWARGFYQLGGRGPGGLRAEIGDRRSESDRRSVLGRRPGLLLRLELGLFSLGYADRLAVLLGGVMTAADRRWPGAFGFPVWLWALVFGLPLAQILAALAVAGQVRALGRRLVVLPFFYLLDVGMAAWSVAQSGLRRPVVWSRTERPGEVRP